MKTSYVVIFLLFSHLAFGQLQESFNDGNFNSSPQWLGDTSFFQINPAGLLQSQGPAASATLHLQTPSSYLTNTEWTFFVRLDFDPSSANYAKVYLCSDQTDLEGPLNGYFVKIGGETGTVDGIDLYRQEGTSGTKIIDGITGHAGKALNSLRIKVIRDIAGNWELLSDTIGGYDFLPEGQVFDNRITSSAYFGVVCIHSSTRKDQFYFDDFFIGEAPLSLVKAAVLEDSIVEISFNKPLDKFSAENPLHYQINASAQPVFAALKNSDPSKVLIALDKPLQNGSYSVTVNSLKDTNGFTITPGSSLSFLYKKPLNYGDLIISEIFSDPSPSVGLPDEEFVELYNNSTDTLDLSGFVFSDGSTSAILPSYKLKPSGYLILTGISASTGFSSYSDVLGISPWPSLNNSEDQLSLKDEKGKVLFKVNYSSEWFASELKKQGGWSLEMVNLAEHCGEKNNWKASENSEGGTPGKQNSVFSDVPDLAPPELTALIVTDSIHLTLTFSEALDTALQSSDFHIDQGFSISEAAFLNSQTVVLTFNQALEIRKLYKLHPWNIRDCKGNTIYPETVWEFLLPETPEPSDIVINEILFNPFPGGSDFIEIYNKSDKVLDLKDWKIGSVKKDTLVEYKAISSQILIHPHNYLCLTSQPTQLSSQYIVHYPERILSLSSLPSYNDDYGTVLLADPTGNTIDRFDYREDFHFPMIDNKEGISLERLSFYSATNNSHNWHSAAETAGWATPGYENSQYKDGMFHKAVSVDPKVFTPDQDAWKDLALISYRFNEPGFVANINIFDVQGRCVKVLAQNALLGREGFFQWDGTNEKGQLADTGYYIIFFEAFNLKGEVKGYKETVVLARKF